MLRPDRDTRERIRTYAAEWIVSNGNGAPGNPWEVEEDPHLTLQFIGRDLSSDQVAGVIAGAFAFAKQAPVIGLAAKDLQFLATRKGIYLVLPVVDPPAEDERSIHVARSRLLQCLRNAKIEPKDTFPFKPHITLLERRPSSGPRPNPGQLPEGFQIEFVEIVVKYGPHRMTIEFEGQR
jgi:2'-5' RNA ligase